MTEDDVIKKFIEDIDVALNTALVNAQHLQQSVQKTEGDSELYRKLAFYLVPNLNHWVSGAQAGSVKDLKDLMARRHDPKAKK